MLYKANGCNFMASFMCVPFVYLWGTGFGHVNIKISTNWVRAVCFISYKTCLLSCFSVFMWFFLTLLDSIIHGGFVFTPYNFFVYNIFHNIGEFYGTQPWHWYLSSGLPAVLGINLLPFVFATVVILKNRRSHINELALLATIVFTVAFYR